MGAYYKKIIFKFDDYELKCNEDPDFIINLKKGMIHEIIDQMNETDINKIATFFYEKDCLFYPEMQDKNGWSEVILCEIKL